MNAIRQTQQLNKRELENATPPSASWHADYRDTAWVYVGGLPLDLSEGDVVTIFSQFGNPTHLNMIRDRETGKSKGFGFLKYEDQRSCDLAVDNLTGADVLGRLLRVDHTRYKKKDDEDEDTYRIERLEAETRTEQNGKRASDTDESEEERKRRKKKRPMLTEKEFRGVAAITGHGEEEDPMKDYLRIDTRSEVDTARRQDRDRDRRHRHRHSSHRNGDDSESYHHTTRRHGPKDGADREENSTRKDRSKPKDTIGEDSRKGNSRTRDRESPPRHDSSDNSNSGKKARRRRSRSRDQDERTHRRRYSSEDNHGRTEPKRERRER